MRSSRSSDRKRSKRRRHREDRSYSPAIKKRKTSRKEVRSPHRRRSSSASSYSDYSDYHCDSRKHPKLNQRHHKHSSRHRQLSPSVDRVPRDATESSVSDEYSSRASNSSRRSSSSKSDFSKKSDASFSEKNKEFIQGDVQLSESVLKNLSEQIERKDIVSINLHNKIISLWSEILKTGCPKDSQLVSFEAIHTPALNPEIKMLMSDAGLKKEGFQTAAQEKLGMAIYGVGAALTTIFNSSGEKDPFLVSCLSDVGRVLSDLHYNVSVTRRSFITPIANKLVKDITEGLPISSKFLFGEDFPEKVKAAEAVRDLSKKIAKPLLSNEKSNSQAGLKQQQGSKNSYRGRHPTLNFRGLSKYPRNQRVQRDGPRYSRTRQNQPHQVHHRSQQDHHRGRRHY